MLTWITANIGTIISAAVVLIILGLAVFSLIRAKKKGQSSCGCGCSNCAMRDACHKINSDVK